MTIVDVHTHLNFAAFDKDRDEVMARAQKAEIKMICVGADVKTSESAIALAEKYPNDAWATVGCHPHYSTQINADDTQISADNNQRKFADKSADISVLKKLAGHQKVVAIGECGLDYYRFKIQDFPLEADPPLTEGFKNKQKEIFIKQIELAQELKKPLMIHCRDAFGDLIKILKSYIINLKSSVIFHFFTGTKKDAEVLLSLGTYFTFGGVITFSRSYDEIIKFLPIENIMLETDAPYVAPELYRGQRNEPVYITEVAKKVAEIKNLEYNKVLERTTENAKKVFGI
jgi:TatD DNase family protein